VVHNYGYTWQEIPLSEIQQSELKGIIRLFSSLVEKDLGLSHDIELTESRSIKQRHYSVLPAVKKLMYQELDRMLLLGVIEESDSPWSSPVVIVSLSC